jgi:hypothetical protein
MRQYIAAVLVPCFLLQLFGCYSYKDITLDELQKYYGLNNIRIKTDKYEKFINRKSTDEGFMNWETGDTSIVIKEISLKKGNKEVGQLTNTYEIKYRQINSVEIEDYDVLKTLGLTLGIILVGVIIIAVATFKIDLFPAGTKF